MTAKQEAKISATLQHTKKRQKVKILAARSTQISSIWSFPAYCFSDSFKGNVERPRKRRIIDGHRLWPVEQPSWYTPDGVVGEGDVDSRISIIRFLRKVIQHRTIRIRNWGTWRGLWGENVSCGDMDPPAVSLPGVVTVVGYEDDDIDLCEI